MSKYRKGSDAERELQQTLWNMGMAVIRVAGSGASLLPAPDLIAMSKKKKLAFECKAWDSAYLTIPKKQMLELKEWSGKAGADFFIAWKIPYRGWLFLPEKAFTKTEKAYTISKSKAKKKSLNLNVITGSQSMLSKPKFK